VVVALALAGVSLFGIDIFPFISLSVPAMSVELAHMRCQPK
jgi:hypothetical protein